jgi:hypothetical protein
MQMHQESRVDALIFLNDMTSFPRDGPRLVHSRRIHAVNSGSVGKVAAKRFPARILDHALQGIRPWWSRATGLFTSFGPSLI